MDIYWRDTCVCPTEEEYKRMVKQSESACSVVYGGFCMLCHDCVL